MTDQPGHDTHGNGHGHGHGNGHGHGHGHGDTTGRHGMLLFGDEEASYLSHLAMFDKPHNVQAVVDVRFDDATRTALAAHRHGVPGEGYDTFDPVVFPLADLDPAGGDPVGTTLKGKVFCGHFERKGGTRPPLAPRAVADVRHVVYHSVLDVNAYAAEPGVLTYLCFGRGGRLYLAHAITTRPSFDHVLVATVVPGTGKDDQGQPLPDDAATLGKFFREEFATAAPVVFRGRRDTPEDRLSGTETVEGHFPATAPPGGRPGFSVGLRTEQEIYLEVRELA
ncbi:hypothetical protein [Streptomyces sp. NPDC047928]|uniref:hypothetical protein n=1 Tax=unclassified Streptomyces TaxID=2593676 RepID=UPI0037105BB3